MQLYGKGLRISHIEYSKGLMLQKISGSKNLEVQEKVELQQYMTRVYDSRTSFNVLFKTKNRLFMGEKAK